MVREYIVRNLICMKDEVVKESEEGNYIAFCIDKNVGTYQG